MDRDDAADGSSSHSRRPHLTASARSQSWGFERASSVPLESTTLHNGVPSIFASGPSRHPSRDDVHQNDEPQTPTSPESSLRPLSALSMPKTPNKLGRKPQGGPSTLPANEEVIATIEKDADDPNSPVDARRSNDGVDHASMTSISRLFAANVALSPPASRTASYNAPPVPTYIRRSLAAESASLPDHLYTRGLLAGRHSDITVNCFGHAYALHRLILDRAPFFTTALSEPWLESASKEITLHPEDTDPNITQIAFELALKRLYGCDISADEDKEAVGLFAAACWLEMQDLLDSSIDAILRKMSPATLSPLIKLVTANDYGRAGHRILASAKAMLCRDGWEMSLRFWDGVPGDTVREIVGSDGFFVENEWERWVLAKRILDRRLRQKAVEAGLIKRGRRVNIKVPDTLGLMAVRFDSVYRRASMSTGRQTPEALHAWVALYTHPDVEPLLVLLDEGIHYLHLTFEQLQAIRQARDVFGLPTMPEAVITNAIWMQLELRQKVLNAGELDLELGVSKPADEAWATTSGVQEAPAGQEASQSAKGKGKLTDDPVRDEADELEEMDSGSWDGNGKPRKFWIPSTDCNIVMGGNADPVVTTSSSFQRHASRLSATMGPEDLQWATDFAASPATDPRAQPPINAPAATTDNAIGKPRPIAYTHYPPFRFAAEFPNPRLLKEKKRVYSRTVFYAGSLWNIYIQKVRSAKNPQLGVYLHRAKESEADQVISGTAGLTSGTVGSVDERIGLLEREMLLRSERRERRRGRTTGRGGTDPATSTQGQLLGSAITAEEDTSGSGGDPDASLSRPATGPRSLFDRRRQHRAASSNDIRADATSAGNKASSSDPLSPDTRSLLFPSFPHNEREFSLSAEDSDSDSDNDHDAIYRIPTPALPSRNSNPTLPHYVDARSTIKTYFKIYSPSKGGRLLSVYESAPDRFNFSQSWGWKSSTLMLDEGFLGASGADGIGTGAVGDDQNVPEALAEGLGRDGAKDVGLQLGGGKRSEGKLRFMVVIGNL